MKRFAGNAKAVTWSRCFCRFLKIAGYGYLLALFLFTLAGCFGYHSYMVATGSMEPELPVGSCIFVKRADAEEIQAGDVITYQIEKSDVTVTHRVTACQRENGCFQTKGDANQMEDIKSVKYSQVLGKVKICIPFLGYLMVWQCIPAVRAVGIVFIAAAFMETFAEGSKEKSTKEKSTKEKSAKEKSTKESKDEKKSKIKKRVKSRKRIEPGKESKTEGSKKRI